MKILLTISTLVFTVMFSSISWGEWTKVSKNVNGTTYYVDFDRIKKHSGYVYYWYLLDKLKPDKWGFLSDKTYAQGACNLFRYKWLGISYHTQPIGGGTGDIQEPLKNIKVGNILLLTHPLNSS